MSPPRKKKARSTRRRVRTAANSDRHELYELSVQNTEAEADFVDSVWRRRRGRLARSLREDFCGTAAMAAEWVKRRRDNTAVGVDIDPEVLAWARSRLPERLTSDQRSRLRLVRGDVLSVRTPRVDTALAMNFSYYLFKTRDRLRQYFRRVRAALVPDGLFILDAYGGSDAFRELQERRRINGFVYIWDQHSYDPITGTCVNYIHYRFKDGSRIRRAFSYQWRLWTLPELRELLIEAGFAGVTVWWEGTDRRTGKGNDTFRPASRGDADPGWIAYLVAEKKTRRAGR